MNKVRLGAFATVFDVMAIVFLRMLLVEGTEGLYGHQCPL